MNFEEILNKYELKSGSHKSIDDGACIMELVSYIANEPWSDHPECACPILTSYAIRLNDRFSHDDRQKLKPLIPKLLNTRNKDKQKIRAHFLVLQVITVFLPILTEALELTEITEKLRSFEAGDWLAARDFIKSSRPAIREAASKRAAAADADAYAAAAAYADAYAAAAADAAAYAYAYAYAYAAAYAAAAADAAAENAPFWREIKEKTINASVRALEQACEL